SAQSLGEFHRVIICPEMHEKKTRLFLDHVTVQRGYGDSILTQRLYYRIHFFSGEDEITGDCRLTIPCRLEVETRRNTHGVGDRHPALGHLLRPGNGK